MLEVTWRSYIDVLPRAEAAEKTKGWLGRSWIWFRYKNGVNENTEVLNSDLLLQRNLLNCWSNLTSWKLWFLCGWDSLDPIVWKMVLHGARWIWPSGGVALQHCMNTGGHWSISCKRLGSESIGYALGQKELCLSVAEETEASTTKSRRCSRRAPGVGICAECERCAGRWSWVGRVVRGGWEVDIEKGWQTLDFLVQWKICEWDWLPGFDAVSWELDCEFRSCQAVAGAVAGFAVMSGTYVLCVSSG